MRQRYTGHLQNDVWERRTEPPQEFTKQLPEHLQKKDLNLDDPFKNACVIS